MKLNYIFLQIWIYNFIFLKLMTIMIDFLRKISGLKSKKSHRSATVRDFTTFKFFLCRLVSDYYCKIKRFIKIIKLFLCKQPLTKDSDHQINSHVLNMNACIESLKGLQKIGTFKIWHKAWRSNLVKNSNWIL